MKEDLKKLTERAFRENREMAAEITKIIREYWRLLKAEGIEGVKIMNFCGTHEWTTTHYGIRSLLPDGVELVAGPGCPVCVTPSFYVEATIKLALEGVKIYTYGDAYKLPAVKDVEGARSLAEAKAIGGAVEVVYSLLDAARDAARNPVDSAFLSIGFETTYPAYAVSIIRKLLPPNLRLIVAGRLTPPAAEYAVEKVGKVSGIIAPGHVSTIIGGNAWKPLAERFMIPVVISGFEPVDVLISVAEILRQLKDGKARLVIEYRRAVRWEGNLLARKMIAEVFDVVDAAWRGIGFIPRSGYKLKDRYVERDALKAHGIREPGSSEWSYDLPSGCRCAEVILGIAKPVECPLFLRNCSPSSPYGPCMVSSEGTCSIWARSGRWEGTR